MLPSKKVNFEPCSETQQKAFLWCRIKPIHCMPLNARSKQSASVCRAGHSIDFWAIPRAHVNTGSFRLGMSSTKAHMRLQLNHIQFKHYCSSHACLESRGQERFMTCHALIIHNQKWWRFFYNTKQNEGQVAPHHIFTRGLSLRWSCPSWCSINLISTPERIANRIIPR